MKSFIYDSNMIYLNKIIHLHIVAISTKYVTPKQCGQCC